MLVTILGFIVAAKGAALFAWPPLVNRSLSVVEHKTGMGVQGGGHDHDGSSDRHRLDLDVAPLTQRQAARLRGP